MAVSIFNLMISFTCFSCSCPLSLLIDEGSSHKGVFQEEPLKLDATKSSGDYEANQYWDTQEQCTLVSFSTKGLSWAFLFTHNENDWLQMESGCPHFCKNWQGCICLWWKRKKNKKCCLLMEKLITVPVCYGTSTVFYISPCSCLQGSCCYVHCYLQSHHSSVNTLSHLWVLLEFNSCSSYPRAVCQALITKTMHLCCWVWEQL